MISQQKIGMTIKIENGQIFIQKIMDKRYIMYGYQDIVLNQIKKHKEVMSNLLIQIMYTKMNKIMLQHGRNQKKKDIKYQKHFGGITMEMVNKMKENNYQVIGLVNIN